MKAVGPLSASLLLERPISATGAAPARATERLRPKFRGDIIVPSDAAYPAALRGAGPAPLPDRHPTIIARPADATDIARALDAAREQGLPISVRSGGHDVLGASTGKTGMLIDLCRLTAISLAPADQIAHVGSGARGGALIAAAAVHDLVPVLGMSPDVGVGGVSLGGGIGWLSGSHGATVDHVLEIELVTADGALLTASAESHPDLFWALRGGGGNFGIATRFTYSLPKLSRVLAGFLTLEAPVRPFLTFLREYLAASPDQLDLVATVSVAPRPVIRLGVCWSGDATDGEQVLHPLRTFGRLLADDISVHPFVNFACPPSPAGAENLFWRGGELDDLHDAAIMTLADIVERDEMPDCGVGVLHYIHGKLCAVPAGRTAFIRDPGHILYNVTASWTGRTAPAERIDWAIATAERLRAVASPRTYINYLSDDAVSAVSSAFGPHYDRLRAIKRQYDPDNIFSGNRNIAG